jgi:hypothetical protein
VVRLEINILVTGDEPLEAPESEEVKTALTSRVPILPLCHGQVTEYEFPEFEARLMHLGIRFPDSKKVTRPA